MALRFFLLLTFLSTASAFAATTVTVAGDGVAGYTGDGGGALTARINNPFGVVRGPDGALYFCDTGNHAIRRIDSEGVITTVAGTGEQGYAGDGGPAAKAKLNEPYEVRFNSRGDLVFVEMKNHVVRLVSKKTGKISTLAGTGRAGFGGDGGPAEKALFTRPHSIQFDKDDHLFICDIGNHRIRRVASDTGIVTTFMGTGGRGATPEGGGIDDIPLNGPRAIDFDEGGDLWLALREGNAVYRVVMEEGKIYRWAGNGKRGFTGNGGLAKEATLSGPKGISIGPNGNIFLADTESHSIRMIDRSTRKLHLVAGTGRKGDGPDGEATGCRMARPHGVYVDRDGTVYVGDSEAHRIRAIRP